MYRGHSALQQTLKALSDPTRREILNLLKSGRLSAGEIADRFDITPAAGALAALRDSRMMTKGNRWNLFRLDLSMWWYYAAVLASAAVAYGDQLLPTLGVTFPLSDTAAYFVFLGVYLAVIFVIYYFLRSRVEVTYALAYDSLRPREPENNGAVLGNIFQM